MDYTIPDHHFENLRHSAQDLFGMGLEVVPAMEMVIDREDYLGYTDFDQWRENHFPELWYPEQFGWEGREIIGSWNLDESLYSGFFPVKITSDGESKVTTKSKSLTEEQVLEQIEAAKEHRILLGIAARPKFTATNFLSPNSLIYASKETLTDLRGERDNLRIETDGSSYWTYAAICFDHREIKKHFVGKNNKLFMLHGGDAPVGRIQKGFFKPCYPSIVFGEQIQTLDPSTKHKPLMILSASLAKVNLEFDDDLYDWDEAEILDDEESGRDDTGWLDEDEEEDYLEESDPNPDWVVHPNEDEALFLQAVSQFERSTGLNKSIIRQGAASASIHSQHQEIKPEELSEEKNTPSECTKNVAALPASELSPSEVVLESAHCWLEELFPPDLADACRVITENLPYDERSVSLAYLTCIASLLKLGTKINGNSLTKYIVPLNLYTAFIGKSGSKKTPLKGLMFDDPASPILLEIDRQNTRALVDWEEKCRGLKKDDKPPRPIPLKLRTQDYSSEALVSCLQKSDEHGRSFGIVRDELNALFKNMNRYAKGQGGDEEQLLELYDGKPFDSSRIANSRSYQRCSVTIYGNLQPSVFAELTKSKDATGQWARFLFVPLPEKTVPLPVECSEDSKRKLQEATTILEEYAIQAFNLNPQEYVLDEEARRIFSAYEHEKQQGVHASACETQSALHGKSASKVLRITGLVHVLRAIHSNKLDSTSVNSETLLRAIALVDDLDHWALSQYAKRDAAWTSKITNEMRRLHNLAFLQKGPMTWTILKDKLSSKETKVINRVKADELFRLLEAMGYGRIDSGPRGGLRYEALMELPPE